MIKCIELDKDFATKEAMFHALKANEGNIISLKKAAIQKSCDKGQLSTFNLFKVTEETKSLLNLKEDYIYPVINTTKYLDSHGDVHLDGIWNKSIKEVAGQLFYVADHDLSIKSVIAWPSDVNAMVKEVPWSFVGKSYEGTTQALIYEIPKSAIKNQQAKEIIEEKRPVQNSVRMQYVKVRLAINSTEKDFTENKEYYDSIISSVTNKEVAEERGYFWGIEEAKIVKEGSMVPFGSNDATPIQYKEAGTSTSEDEPGETTQKDEEQKTFINSNLY